MKTVITGHKQSVFDLAIQEYGSVEGLFRLLLDNPVGGADTVLQTGQELKIKSEPVDRKVAAHYTKNDWHPATGDNIQLFEGGDFNEDFNNDYFD